MSLDEIFDALEFADFDSALAISGFSLYLLERYRVYEPNFAVRLTDFDGRQYVVICMADTPEQAAELCSQHSQTHRDVDVWPLGERETFRRNKFERVSDSL